MIVIVMGVSGSGKTTIGELLAPALGAEFLDADDYHSEENRRKLASGVPLEDEDRIPWLERLATMLRERAAKGESVVLACSALRAHYRAILRVSPEVRFVSLDAPPEVLAERLLRRKGHFMNAALLKSQLETLEPPRSGIIVDARPAPEQIVKAILKALEAPAVRGAPEGRV